MGYEILIQIVGVISVLTALFAIWFILFSNERDISQSLSHHVASSRKNHLIFASMMTVSIAGLAVFVYLWLIPYHNLSNTFSLLIGIALILELITTWVPLTYGWKKLVHNICSYGAALLLPALLIMISMSSSISNVSLYVCLASIFFMLFFLVLFIFVKSTHSRYLIFQTSYVVFFYVSILSLALIK